MGFERVVLAVTRTVTTTTRLLDVLDLVREDPRVQVVFTMEPGSAFTDGVADFVRAVGGRMVPWAEAVGMRFDLAVSASDAGELHRLDAPVIVLPHGVGHNKYLKAGSGRTRAVSGFAAHNLLHEGRVVPSAIVLSHAEQRVELARCCPEALPRAVVAGDVCFERLRTSVAHRHRYRASMGLHEHQRLIVVNSTWGRGSVVGNDLGLATRLLARLPTDEYRVALILHPAVWFGHSPWQVRGWLHAAIGAGLLLIPPHEGWRATLVAGDLLITDHGSVGLYGAAVGLPLLLGAFDHDEVVPDTPMAALAEHVPRLNRESDLRAQVDRAIAGHDPASYRVFTDRAFGLPGLGAKTLQGLLYRTMALSEPERPAHPRPVADPVPEVVPVAAHRVTTAIVDDLTVAVERFPATLPEPALPHSIEHDQHLVAEEDVLDSALLQSAAVVLSTTSCPDPASWGRSALDAHPGARVAATPRLLVVRTRASDRLLDVTSATAPPAVVASAVYAMTAAGRMPTDHHELTIRLGGVAHRVSISPPR